MSTSPADTGEAVAAAMRAIPRADFLPAEVRAQAEVDAPLPIGFGQTNSQPSTVAFMLRLLDVPVGGRVLDVGAGSGWTTALLSWLVGPEGRVIGVERHLGLLESAARALARHQVGRAEVRLAVPGTLGVPEEAPFDRILVSAEADRIPSSLVSQLADGGAMVLPVGPSMVHLTRRGDEITTRRLGQFRFVPLIEE